MKVLITGAGIGGLAAALSLHAAGFTDVRVIEAAPSIRPAGVGLNLLPNAVRELTELRVYAPLAEHGVATQELCFFNRDGKSIWSEPRGLAAGYLWPQLSIHRGHLQTMLARAVRERLGADAITTGTRLVHCASTGSQVRAVIARAGAGPVEIEDLDLLIGADGIRSAVRAACYPGEGPPPGNGLVMWRGTTWAAPFLTGASMVVAGTDTQRVVLYPIARIRDDGCSLINWVAAQPDETEPAESADWHHHATVADVLDRFGHWRFEWLDVAGIFRAASHVYRYPMVDRDPLPQWVFGRIVLLGDAAHAMYPMGSNGATQAIVDARVLAHALATASGIDEALTRFEAERLPAMTQLQISNRGHGPEAVISLVHQRAPRGFDDLSDVISEQELAEMSARYARTAGFDVGQVNTRSPLGVRRMGGHG